MMDIKEDWLLWFINFLIKRLQVVVLNLCHKMNPLLEKLKREKRIQHLNICAADLADMH